MLGQTPTSSITKSPGGSDTLTLVFLPIYFTLSDRPSVLDDAVEIWPLHKLYVQMSNNDSGPLVHSHDDMMALIKGRAPRIIVIPKKILLADACLD